MNEQLAAMYKRSRVPLYLQVASALRLRIDRGDWSPGDKISTLEELEKDKSRRELVARVTGNPAARFNEPVKFHANWQPVTLSEGTVGVTLEECELLDQMSPGVFHELGLRVVRSRLTCESSSLLPPEMVVEALLPATYPGSNGPPEGGPATEKEDETKKEGEKAEEGQ